MEQPRVKKKAAALKYDVHNDAAPVLAAVGEGVIAENILRTAEEHDVPIVEDASTVEVLAKLSVGDAIPPALYQAVAQILIFVSELDQNATNKRLKF